VSIELPEHIPPQLVVEDYPFPMGAKTTLNPFTDLISTIHEKPPIFYSTNAYPIGIPAWIPRRMEDIQAIYLDTDHFSSAKFSPFATLLGQEWQVTPVEIDPPEHTGYRRILNPLFTPKRLMSLEEKVRDTARWFVSRFADKNQCEFMSEFAMRFPIVVFLDLMEMPRDRIEQFLEWEGMLLHSMDFESIIRGTQYVVDYLHEIIEERRQNPGDDLVSIVVGADIDGRPLTQDEILGMCFNLYIGGLDTVTTNISWQVRHLAENPKHQQYLRDHPEKIPSAIESLYRRYAAVTTFRTCTKPINIGGVQMMPGDKVAVSTTLANNDPEEWGNPFEVDIEKPPLRHMTFGFGVHRCVGAPLARRESVIAIEEILAAVPAFRIPEGAEVTTELGPILQLKNLPLEW
jgi:cytochrome P450